MSGEKQAPSFSMVGEMAKRENARATKGKDLISPLFLNRHFNNLKESLDEMKDAFSNNACLDVFNHSCKMSEGEIRKIKERYSFPSCIKVREPNYNDITCNWDPERLCVFKGALVARLRFPVYPFIIRLLAAIKVHPCQLFPNSWRLIVIFMLRCHQLEIPFSNSMFRSIFLVKSSPEERQDG